MRNINNAPRRATGPERRARSRDAPPMFERTLVLTRRRVPVRRDRQRRDSRDGLDRCVVGAPSSPLEFVHRLASRTWDRDRLVVSRPTLVTKASAQQRPSAAGPSSRKIHVGSLPPLFASPCNRMHLIRAVTPGKQIVSSLRVMHDRMHPVECACQWRRTLHDNTAKQRKMTGVTAACRSMAAKGLCVGALRSGMLHIVTRRHTVKHSAAQRCSHTCEAECTRRNDSNI
jgi:hypothetical protein